MNFDYTVLLAEVSNALKMLQLTDRHGFISASSTDVLTFPLESEVQVRGLRKRELGVLRVSCPISRDSMKTTQSFLC